jgi:hypothetical protein
MRQNRVRPILAICVVTLTWSLACFGCHQRPTVSRAPLDACAFARQCPASFCGCFVGISYDHLDEGWLGACDGRVGFRHGSGEDIVGLLVQQGYLADPPTPFRPGVLTMRMEAYSGVTYCCCGSAYVQGEMCSVDCESEHVVDPTVGAVDLRLEIVRVDPSHHEFPQITFSTGRRLELGGEPTPWAISDPGWGTRRRPPFDDGTREHDAFE